MSKFTHCGNIMYLQYTFVQKPTIGAFLDTPTRNDKLVSRAFSSI